MSDFWNSQLSLVGTNHKHASIQMRERLWCQPASLPGRLKSVINGSNSIKEAVILSTCNRTEIYVICADDPNIRHYVTQLMSEWSGIQDENLKHHIYSLTDEEAVGHLFAVSSGLDSLVIGDQQIRNQVKDAKDIARQAGTAGPFLSELFEHASRVAKNIRDQSKLRLDKASVSWAAVSFLMKVSSDRHIHSMLLVGAGNMITLALERLAQSAKLEFWIANRTIQQAEKLAKRFGGKPLSINEIPKALEATDAVLSCTSSPSHIIFANDVEAALSKRNNKPLILIDMAVPRNIDPAAARIPGIRLYNIDDLAPFLEEGPQFYRPQIAEAKRQVRSEAQRFWARIRTYSVVPTVRELRMMAEEIRGSELSRALGRLRDVSDRDRKIVDLLTRRIVNKLLHEPTVRLRQQAAVGNSDTYEAAIRELFAMPKGSWQ